MDAFAVRDRVVADYGHAGWRSTLVVAGGIEEDADLDDTTGTFPAIDSTSLLQHPH